MDLKQDYDEYWQFKPYGIEEDRILEVCAEFKAGERVLDIGCGKGEMAHALKALGVDVIGVDFSEVAARRAREGGVDVLTFDFEKEPLPFDDGRFDGVIFTQTAEHVYDFRPVMSEIRRVLNSRGRLVFAVPNIGHWRFRAWLLFGDFPYIEDTQTHWQHMRFFTVKSALRVLREQGFEPLRTEGTAGMFSPVHPAWVKLRGIRRVYGRLSRVFPSLFAFHVTFVCAKRAAKSSVAGAGRSTPALPERINMPLKWLAYRRGRDRAFGFPKRVYLESTNRCNLGCKMCPSGLGVMKRPKGDMSPDIFDGVVGELMGHTKALVLHIWGEPLLNKNLAGMIERASGAGFRTELSTNATLLTPEMSKDLIGAGLSTIYLCLDGATKQTYEEIRRRADYEQTSDNIRSFLALKKDSPFVNLQIIAMRETEAEIEQFRRAWQVPGVDKINVKALDTWAGQVDEINSLQAENRAPERRWPCPLLWYHAHIYWDGTLVSCDRDFDAVRPLGSVEQGVVAAWNSPAMRELRRRHAEGDLKSTPLCKDCREWAWWQPTPFKSWGNAPAEEAVGT